MTAWHADEDYIYETKENRKKQSGAFRIILRNQKKYLFNQSSQIGLVAGCFFNYVIDFHIYIGGQ